MELSIWDLLNHGYGAMWVVIAFSVIALAVAIERGVGQWSLMNRTRQLGEIVRRELQRGAVDAGRTACERSHSPLADILLVGFGRLNHASAEHVATAVHRERLRVNQDLRARLWMLGTIGATAPFVGLFGTVVGIMTAMGGFKASDNLSLNLVAGPISQALIVTAAGIVVAVEAVLFYNFFGQRASRIAVELKLLTDEFLELLLEPDHPKSDRGDKSDKSDKNGKSDKSEKSDKKESSGGDREAA